ncbi:MAG: hypothetical protein NVS9B4_16040 [Candidatus Acidiferrum sp.]
MKVGDTFLYPLSPPHAEHLWIVLTNPDADGSILIVSVTTAYSNNKDCMDGTVTLNRGEHPFLTKELSYLYYRGAMIKKVSELQGEERAGLLKRHSACSDNLISLARGGVAASPHCNRNVKRYYGERKDLKP